MNFSLVVKVLNIAHFSFKLLKNIWLQFSYKMEFISMTVTNLTQVELMSP